MPLISKECGNTANEAKAYLNIGNLSFQRDEFRFFLRRCIHPLIKTWLAGKNRKILIFTGQRQRRSANGKGPFVLPIHLQHFSQYLIICFPRSQNGDFIQFNDAFDTGNGSHAVFCKVVVDLVGGNF